MPLPVCPDCGSADVDLLERLPDTRRHLTCLACQRDWLYGEAVVERVPVGDYAAARRRFPTVDAVREDVSARTGDLKRQFLHEVPTLDAAVGPYWAQYQQVFSEDGLDQTAPQLLKDFANSSVGANPGNMSVFNTAWNEMGELAAASQVRAAVRYLLYGPENVPIEDRLTRLIHGDGDLGMKGFRESLLTKVLCIMEPDRFLPILMYTGVAGKREIAQSVYGVSLPSPQATSATPGRLVFWSNDLLRELVGDGFASVQHASEFLWWAKDQREA